MGRIQLSTQRLFETRKTYIGHIIIFCEGQSEKEYFDYFAQIVKKNKYTDVEVVLETAGGNAQGVLNYANTFMENEKNNQKFGLYDKYLAFDCDAPPDIQAVLASATEYKWLLSNTSFEIWLLMHFEDLYGKLTKTQLQQRLSRHLRRAYSKGSKGITREIIQNGNIERAIDNARNLEKQYAGKGKYLPANVKEMNPYTSVYKLVEQFMMEIS